MKCHVTAPLNFLLFVSVLQIVRSIGPLEYILNTPSHHRVHHGNSLHMIDTVYSASKQNVVKILMKMRNERILSLAGVF